MKSVFLLFLIFAARLTAATGDVTPHGVSRTGWQLDLGINGLATGGTYALGASADHAFADIANGTSKVVLSVTSEGYTATDSASSNTATLGTIARTIYGRTKVARPHSDTGGANLSVIPLTSITGVFLDGETITQTTSGATFVVLTHGHFDLIVRSGAGTPNGANIWTGGTSGATATPSGSPATYTAHPNRENLLGSDFHTLLSLTDYVYADDTSLLLTVAGGAYTAGGTPNNALTSTSVTNNSLVEYPKVNLRWASIKDVGRAVQGNFTLEATAFSPFGIAAVVFSATDGTTTITQTVTTRTASGTDSYKLYRATFAASSFTQSAVVTCNVKAYPLVGDADSVRDSSTGTWPSLDLCPLKLIADAADTYRTYAYVDGVGGGTPAVSTNPATARTTPYASVALAGAAIRTYNNASRGRDNLNGDEIRVMAGNYLFGRGASNSAGTVQTGVPVTITRDEQATAATVIFNGFNATSREAWLQTRVYDVTIAESNIIFGGATTQVWFDSVIQSGVSDTNPHSGVGMVAYQDCSSTGFSDPYCGTSLGRAMLARNCTGSLTGSAVIFREARALVNVRVTGAASGTWIFWSNQSVGTACSNVVIDGCVSLYSGNIFINFSSDVLDFSAVNCVAEVVGIASTPLLDLEGNNITNATLAHITGAGQRTNAENDWTANTNKTCENFFLIGHASPFIAHKDDEYLDDSAHSILIGQWPRKYGVGWRGNASISTVFPPQAVGYNDAYGVTPYGFVDDNSITGSNDGNGNYRIISTSTFAGRSPLASVIAPWDITGEARSAIDASGAYHFGTSGDKFFPFFQ